MNPARPWLLGVAVGWVGAAGEPAWPLRPERGFVAHWDCRESPLSDTVRLGSGRNAFPWTDRSELWRNGSRLLDGQDFTRPSGDSLLLLAAIPTAGDTVCLVFRVSPALPHSRLKLYDTSEVPVFRAGNTAEPGSPRRAETVATDTGAYRLDLSGSKSVSVSVGQGGTVGLDASLFVTLNGQVADNVFLEGSLSDQNVPVQPEGSTANLREVDNKYLRVYGRQYEYLLGDYLLGYGREGEDRFVAKSEGAALRFASRGVGLAAQYARSKGVFRTDTLRGSDGKQAGYYLRGRDGRTSITVLAGTERIWRNGALLRRGADYTIDYPEGRVDFLNAFWVTGQDLFAAEFQYSEESFPRSVATAEISDSLGRFRFSLRAAQEWDDKDHPASGTPDTASLRRYGNLGDSAVLDSAGRLVPMPQRLGGSALSAEWDGGDFGQARFTALGSVQDKNLYSDRGDGDNLGFSTRYRGLHRFGRPWDQDGWLRFQLEPQLEHRSENFGSFHQFVEPRGFRDAWNLDAVVGEKNFDANRLRATLEPYTGFQVGAEGGFAEGITQDSSRARSRRGEVFSGLRAGPAHVALSSEAKLASDPGRRDNYRQSLTSEALLGGWIPKAQLLHDEWIVAAPSGASLWSHLWQPEAALESPALWNRWTWGTGVNSQLGQSNYGGRQAAPEDSLFDVGVSQKLRLLVWGLFSGDVFAARRFHRAWNPRADGSRGDDPEEAVYDQAEANLAASGTAQGYDAQTHYKISRTAEVPLVERYEPVAPGRGNYIFDSLLRQYHRVEVGGDFVFVGLQRDTTLGRLPYQDLQWSARLNLSPGRWPFIAGGVLADIDLGVDVETDHQDSSGDPVPLPRLTDDQIEAVRAGRARYEPTLHWRSSGGHRSATARFRREYAKGAGLYAFRERSTESSAEYRREWSEEWESSFGGEWDFRRRAGLSPSSGAGSHAETQKGSVALYRHFPRAYTLSPSLEYQRVQGEDASLPVDLQGLTPKLRVEKGSFFGGRASLEYALHDLFGNGEGSYFATGGYAKGVTHRVEALAQAELQTYLHLNLSYLARLEPNTASWDQKLTAELRAVF